MASAVPVIGLGLSAVGQISSMNAQRRQANAQAEAARTQTLIARDRLRLNQEQLAQQKVVARSMRERELAINVEQERQARLQNYENDLRSQLNYTQAALEADTIKAQAAQQFEASRQAASNILLQASQQAAQLSANRGNVAEQTEREVVDATDDQLSQLFQVANAGIGDATLNVDAIRDEAGRAVLGGLQDSTAADAQLQRQIGYDTQSARVGAQQARTAGDIALGQGNLTANFAALQNRLQQRMDAIGSNLAQSDIAMTSQRNRLGIQAQEQARIGAANMAELSAMSDFRAQAAQSAAVQRQANASKPGFFSYLNVLGGTFNGLQRLGMFTPEVNPADYAPRQQSVPGIPNRDFVPTNITSPTSFTGSSNFSTNNSVRIRGYGG